MTDTLELIAYCVGFADGSDGRIRENPYTEDPECRAYVRGRRDGEKYYRQYPDYEHDTEGGE